MSEKNRSKAPGEEETLGVSDTEEPEILSPEKVADDRAELEEKLRETEKAVEALKQESLRLKADFLNYRARVERESARMKILAAESAVINLLPVLDNLDRAIGSAESQQGQPLLEGVRLVRSQFFGALQAMGLEEIQAEGCPFNPETHEAILASPVEDPSEDGKILEVLQKGYRLGDRVVRPVKVRVGRYGG
jgi:molecular chaperone GrpE (heat shock protein)